MPRTKTILTENDITKICNIYTTKVIGVENLALMFHVNKNTIKDILLNNNISIRRRGGQKTNNDKILVDRKTIKYPPIDGKYYVAKDKNSDFMTKDYMNAGGHLTTHIRNVYGVEIPNLRKRQHYYETTGNYWWEQWFDIVLEDVKPTKKCPYCDWETTDVKNKGGSFYSHIHNVHNITKEEHLKNRPEDITYLTSTVSTKNLEFETNQENFVTCKICGKKLARIHTNHLKTHNITKTEYILKYGNEDLMSQKHKEIATKHMSIINSRMTFKKSSNAEIEIKKMLLDLGFSVKSDRTILKGQEIDIYIPELKIGIEYNGVKWHTEWFGGKDRYYHLSKLEDCNKNGVKLITIFEDEYETKKDLVIEKIKHILHKEDNNKPKIFGRKCQIIEIDSKCARNFLEKNHIQGFSASSIYLGAFHSDILISVMTFKKETDDNWDLVRFATNNKYICCGVGGKLFHYFIKNFKFKEIKTFADRRWTLDSNDNFYTKLGFKLESVTKPEYTYYNSSVNRYKRFHKFNFRKQILLRRYPNVLDKSMTEQEMVKKLGFDRIWDCGLFKYVYRNKLTHKETESNYFSESEKAYKEKGHSSNKKTKEIFSNDYFIGRAKKIHENNYDYSKVKYVNNRIKVCIICPKHGEFFQAPYSHLQGHGCPKCSHELHKMIHQSNTANFIRKSKKIHGDKYDYSKVVYFNCREKVIIVCPIHGEFQQIPNDHLNGCGCPKCSESNLENEVSNFLTEKNINFERQKTFPWLGKQRLDFYLPDYNIAIECQGEQHFKPVDFAGKGDEWSERQFEKVQEMDLIKKELCTQNSIQILYFTNLKYYETFLTEKIYHNFNQLLENIYNNKKK